MMLAFASVGPIWKKVTSYDAQKYWGFFPELSEKSSMAYVKKLSRLPKLLFLENLLAPSY